MTFEVVLTERAQHDLDDACHFIARHAPETAEKWRREFLESLLKLESHPQACPLAAESAEFSFELRQYLHRTRSGRVNRALLTIVGNQVRVLAIRRPGQQAVRPEDLR
jgi:plasmid stabilization system protein ParE